MKTLWFAILFAIWVVCLVAIIALFPAQAHAAPMSPSGSFTTPYGCHLKANIIRAIAEARDAGSTAADVHKAIADANAKINAPAADTAMLLDAVVMLYVRTGVTADAADRAAFDACMADLQAPLTRSM